MYVCICRGVSDREIRHHIQSGAESVSDMQERCGAGGDCGACVGEIETLLSGAQASSSSGHRQALSTADLSLSA